MSLSLYILNGELVIIFSNKDTKWYNSLRFRLFISFFCISFFPLIFFSNIIKNTIELYFRDMNEKELLYQANKIAINIQESDYLSNRKYEDALNFLIDEKSKEEDYRILIIDDKGIVKNDTNRANIGKTLILPEIIVALGGSNEANYYKNEGVIYASSYIEGNNGNKNGAVLLISSFKDTQSLITVLTKTWFLAIMLISIVIGIFIYFTAGLIINPVKNILNTINSITEGKTNQRTKIKGNNEMAKLGEAFNDMTEKLEQIDTSRQEFVSNVSHELKTPLSSIKVLSDSILLQEDTPIEMYKEFLQDINSEIDRMTEIVNNLLALVKLDYTEITLTIEETDLAKMLDDILKMVTPLAKQKNIDLSCEYVKNIVIDADSVKLSLAISNLIENAIKYTDNDGSVKITLDGDHQNTFITITDTGIGINEEEQGKIFNRFYRVDKTRDRETGGTGLGLSITHKTVMLHNGSIKLSSKENEGSTFVVRLPIKYVKKDI